MSKKLLLAASAVAILSVSPAFAANDADLEAIRAEIQAIKEVYETKIGSLEDRLAEMEEAQASQVAASVEPAAGSEQPTSSATLSGGRRVADNSFNPSIGVILQGKYNAYSNDGEIAGFAIGEEAERSEEGLTLDETEINFAASVDDKFRGSATIALHEHEGEGIEIEIEEAFIETFALPHGFNAKAGRFFADIGYLNSLHTHADEFADRPLPYRVFLNKAYNDDGVQVSWLLPTDIYTEIGGGLFRGDDFPAGGSEGSDFGSWTAFGRIGGDINENTAWRIGLSTLQSDGIERSGNEDTIEFDGDSDLYIVDARAIWTPTGNSYEQEVILQGEYFYRNENGTYNDTDAGTGAIAYDGHQSGWYAQSVYKFSPKWRIGGRYSKLYAGDVPVGLAGSGLDDGGHNPWSATGMLDWTNSEFSRLRLQYSYDELAEDQEGSTITLQYIMSIGAHGAHPF